MDHQLSDELNLDNAMGVDFEPGADEVVSQADISLQSSDVEGMAMELEHIEEQSMLMESGGEEIIGTQISGLIDEEFTLDGGSYIVQDGKVLETNTNYQSNILKSETMMDLQFEPQTHNTTASSTNIRTQLIPIKAANRPSATAPKQVAIAPKPAPRPVSMPMKVSAAPAGTKHVAIAPRLGPKPVALTAVAHGPAPVVKTMSLSDVLQGQKGGQTLLTQMGKQFVMMPAGAGGQKIKLVQAGGQTIQAQYVNNKILATGQAKKQVMAKVIVTSQASGQKSGEPSTVVGGVSAGSTPRFVQVQPRTVAISLDSLANKIMGSPTKHGVRFSKPKQHIVTVQATSPTKLLPRAAAQKVDGSKSVVLKSAVAHRVLQRTQIHQINVPGKGVQYIRLVTNPTTNAKASAAAAPAKNIVFTDSKGNLIQMSAEKVLSGGQPPPLLVPGGASLSKVIAKPQQKLVRIAPVVAKTSQANSMQFPRSGQSLLAPVTMPVPAAPVTPPPPPSPPSPPPPEDSKAALRALIEDAVREESQDAEDTSLETQDVEVDFERQQSPEQEEEEEEDNDDSMDRKDTTIEEHPLIVIPSNFEQREESNSNDKTEEKFRMNIHEGNSFNFMNVNADMSAYQSPPSPVHEEDLDDRPRKACNCTKSQCLKLYCDCFANGEFCNRCNCTNCHNNLENEELRQKAIRGCLDRNPNAFRPKIGKSRAGGPETIRRHNKGCNCKRSGCLKNYCECYEAKIACTAICKCVGCRNVEMALERMRRRETAAPREPPTAATALYRPPPAQVVKQPCSFMTSEVIEAVCQCLLASGAESEATVALGVERVLEECARCLQDIITASQQGPALQLMDGSM